MIRRLVLAASAVAAIGLTGCNGGNNSTYTPPPACIPNISSSTTQLVYPAPGSTGVPGSIAQIVIAVNAPLTPANAYNLSLVNTASGLAALTLNSLQPITAAQLPAGSAATTIPNPTYESVQLVNSLYNNFSSGSTVQIALNYNGDCTPTNIPNATFTLQ